ncbi:divalent-cation tolerance protein CutA [Oxalicibacterium flavum]|uniref:Divalent-cation tolerance protein CutA n=2 Tax=Oxalicibacterium flavum TaxID=179467 RepID=A0A8J2XYM7_9BURK|nr:divalent-cation tolerance protein CutA [Oxalicibacterium flavum]
MRAATRMYYPFKNMLTTQHMLLVLTTWPDRASAAAFAQRVLEARLAACVHIGMPVQALYRWQGKIEQGEEIPLQIKTTQARYAEVQAAIQAAHPYDVPEIVAVPISEGLPAYMNWGAAETEPLQRT